MSFPSGGRRARAAAAALALLAAAAAQRNGPGQGVPAGTARHGRQIYARLGCAACHATTRAQEERDGLLRAGHPLEGAAYRGTWWNGRIATDAGDAAEFCLRSFIDPNSTGFTAQERKALVLFMQGLGARRGQGVSPLALLRRDAGDVELSSGDAVRGAQTYRRACLPCHEAGAEPIRDLVGDLSPAQVAGVIRSGLRTMPFFQVDRLSGPQVADIVAYLESITSPPDR